MSPSTLAPRSTTYYVLHPHHSGVDEVETTSPYRAAQVAAGRNQEAGVRLTVYWGDVEAHGSLSVAV